MATQPQSLQEVSAEENELKSLLDYLNRYPKLKRWAELFFNKENKGTYGNRTEATIQAGYEVKDRISAAVIGAQNFKKLKDLPVIFAEDLGITFNKFLEPALARAMTSENPRWWEMMAEYLGYKEPKMALQINNNTQNNTQININEPEAIDFNAKFQEFLEQE